MGSTHTEPRVVAVCVGQPIERELGGRRVRTGIIKGPVEARVAAGALGLAGDGQADLSVHGGPDKAIYVYSRANTLRWCAELGRDDLGAGSLGENLTLDDLPEDAVHIGDRFRVGSALVEVTQPREPCFKLALKLGLPTFPKRFLASGRVGFYLRVLEPGELGAGDPFERVHAEPSAVSIREIHELMHFAKQADPGSRAEALRRALGVPALADAWRGPLQDRLVRIEAGA